MTTVNEPPVPSRARAVAVYNAARIGLFVGCLVLGYVAGLRGLLLLAAALLVSGVLSYFLLARQRIAMGIAVEEAIREQRRRMAERAAAEDRADEEHRAAQADQSQAAVQADQSQAAAQTDTEPTGEPPES